MTKEEKIKEAWGELWHSLHFAAKKCALENNGYISGILANGLKQPFTEWDEDVGAWIPKSLRGIENNNGWIKIESEDDLPKEDLVYWVVKDNQIIDMEVWEISLAFHNKRNITHYQPIEKPKPPIY